MASNINSTLTFLRLTAFIDPVCKLVGTSLAIGIPILVFRRARGAALKASLENNSAAPRRRVVLPSLNASKSAGRETRPVRRVLPSVSTTVQPNAGESTKPSSEDWDSSPSLLRALSNAKLSNAMLAGRAFLIATTLVGVGACGLVYSVQYLTGTYTVPDFARRMRYWTNQYLYPITDRIHRGPETDEERRASHEVAVPCETEWTWEEAEERMKKAYDEGGYTLWAKVALRELEAEARAERAKRRREIIAEVQSQFRHS